MVHYDPIFVRPPTFSRLFHLFRPLRMRLLAGRSPAKTARITSPRERLDRGVASPAVSHRYRTPKGQRICQPGENMFGIRSSLSPQQFLNTTCRLGGEIVMESTLRVARLNHFPMAELTAVCVLRRLFLKSRKSVSIFRISREHL